MRLEMLSGKWRPFFRFHYANRAFKQFVFIIENADLYLFYKWN